MISQSKLSLNLPCPLVDIVYIQVLVAVVPAYHIQTGIEIEHIVAERTHFRQITISLHQIILHIELKAFLGTYCLVKATENKYSLAVNRHAHSQIASSPGTFGM